MSTKITVNGRSTSIPGIYTQIKSGRKNPPLNLPYGNVCIIDTGVGAGFVGGSGVSGNNSTGIDSVLSFSSMQEMRAVCRGGVFWKIAENLFTPNRDVPGVSKVFFIKAAATTKASISFILNGNTITLSTKDEGLCTNGTLVSSELSKGFAFKMKASANTGFYTLTFYLGNYKGVEQSFGGQDYDYEGIKISDSKPVELFTTPEFDTFDKLVSWMTTNPDFQVMFSFSTTIVTPGTTSTAIPSSDFTTITTAYKLFTGGTETYSSTHYDTVLDIIDELDFSAFLAPDYGDNATSTYNTKLLYHINNEAKYDKFMIVGGGIDSSKFKTGTGASIVTAKTLNSQKVVVVHGGYKETSLVSRGTIIRDTFYKSASILGRICGLTPQTPLTYKKMPWLAEVHTLSKDEKELALSSGVLTTFTDSDLGICILQGINSLQQNDFLVNNDSTSHLIAVNRIIAQLNKEIMINAKLTFFNSEVGLNRGTVSPEDLQVWLSNFLTTKIGNLILSWRNIVVEVVEDCYNISYGFEPNYEINKMVFTGIIL